MPLVSALFNFSLLHEHISLSTHSAHYRTDLLKISRTEMTYRKEYLSPVHSFID